MKIQRHATTSLVALALLLAPLAALAGGPVAAAPVGRAAAEIENARPERGETAFGRLVADAMRTSTKSDIALVNAGSLRRGTLNAGPVQQADIDALLSFNADEVVTLTITGAQLRAALERAVQAYPTNSSAFLHGAGFSGEFNAQAPINRRVSMVRVRGREVGNEDKIKVAMPVSLAEGSSGFFTIWNAQNVVRSGTSLGKSVADFFGGREVSPDPQVRFRVQP